MEPIVGDRPHLAIVRSAHEFDKVLHLRHAAYLHAGKIAAGRTPESLEDEFDERSIIIAASLNGAMVGSVRVIVHEATDRLSYGRYFPALPETLPPKLEFVESSRLCIHPIWHGRGIAFSLAAALVIVAAQLRPFVIGGSTTALLPFWQQCGFKPTGDVYTSTDLNDIPHHLILLDAHAAMAGRNTSPRFHAVLQETRVGASTVA